MAYFPMFVDLEGADCLLVGGGKVALHKVQILSAYGARLTVITPDVLPELEGMSNVDVERRAYVSADVENRALVIAATDDRCVNARVAEDCRRHRIPINVVDDKELCSFIFPTLIQEGLLSVGISTSGASPSAAQDLKRRFQAAIPLADAGDGEDSYAEILAFLEGVRPLVKAKISDSGKRASCFRALYEECLRLERVLTDEEVAGVIREKNLEIK